MIVGFDPKYTVWDVDSMVNLCRTHVKQTNSLENYPPETPKEVELKKLKKRLNVSSVESLTLLTIMIAGVDAFNPCAFFVLMFLMSMMIRSKSRARMLLVGGIFVFFSGLLYFLYMAAWLTVFIKLGTIPIVTIIAAVIVLLIGVINIKDYFWFKQGVSLSIPDGAKPGLFERMRGILSADNLWAFIVASIGLAVFANLYEFLCTMGFPAAYTQILKLNDLSTSQYFSYLVLYNLVYVIPLAVIVGAFVWTMKIKKLQEAQGRNLKLISGMLMLALGMVLLLKPELLQSFLASMMIVASAVVMSLAIIVTTKK
jgi:hypothetical protein